MGFIDRSFRTIVIAAVAALVALLVGPTVAGIVLFAVAGVMLVTAVSGFAFNYVLLGISTNSRLHCGGRHHVRGGHA